MYRREVTVSAYFLPLLIFLFGAVQVSIAQIPIRPTKGVRLYLGIEKRVLPNYSLISQNQISSQPGDGLWCQSANNGTNIGTWYQPNGRPMEVSNGGSSSFPLQPVTELEGQTGLININNTALPIEGLYRCVILNENGTAEELVVGIYTQASYNNQVGPRADNETLQFNLLSPREANLPVFTLTFNITHRPPTNVSCTLNNSLLSTDDITREVIQFIHPIIVMVTVTIRGRERGEYRCSVTNSRVDNLNVLPANTSTKFITVTNPVSNLQGTRLNSTSIFLSWTAPPSLGGGQGYEIHTKFANTSTQSVKVHTTTDTSTVVTHSIKDVTSYEIFVVAFGGNLPSLPISLATITTLADKSVFEVCGGSFLECDKWRDTTKLIVGSIFKSSLIQIIQDVCPSCDTNTHLMITNDTIQCSNDNTVVYSATLTNTDINSVHTSDQLLTLIHDSLSNGVTIHDGSNVLTLRNNCSLQVYEPTTSTLPNSNTCTPTIITRVTTLTLTQSPSPSQMSPKIQPTITATIDSVVMDNIRFISIGGAVLLIAVLVMVISTVCILIIAKIKYERLKAKLFINLKRHSTDFEMIECDAYQSTDELRTITDPSIQLYSTLSYTKSSTYHHPNIASNITDSSYSTLSVKDTSTHMTTGLAAVERQWGEKECPIVVGDGSEIKKEGPHVYEHIK